MKARNAGVSNGMSWVRELEDRQRVALRSAKREKNILESRNSDSEVDSFFDSGSDSGGSGSDNADVDIVRRVDSSSSSSSRSRSVRESDRDRELDRESYGDRDRDGERRREMSGDGDGDQDSISIMSSSTLSSSSSSSFSKPTTSSELDFVLQYENEIGNNDRDECDGQDESEGGAIDRALKLLGLDGRRTSSQGSTR